MQVLDLVDSIISSPSFNGLGPTNNIEMGSGPDRALIRIQHLTLEFAVVVEPYVRNFLKMTTYLGISDFDILTKSSSSGESFT